MELGREEGGRGGRDEVEEVSSALCVSPLLP